MRGLRVSSDEKTRGLDWAAQECANGREAYLQDEGYLACVRDILEHPVFQSMNRYIQHGDTTCKAHCIQVSYFSYRICRKYGWNARGAARAGLLHDLFLYDWHSHARETGDYFHGYTHPRTALQNAERHFSLTDAERDMILCHMWPLTLRPPRTMGGMAIVYADKACSLGEIFAKVKGVAACGWKLMRL